MNDETKKRSSVLYDVLKTYQAVEGVHTQVFEASIKLGTLLQANPRAMPEEDMCDVGFMLRECERMLESARLEMKHKKDAVSKLLALRVTKRCIAEGSVDVKVHGELATATPDVRMRPVLPKSGTAEWNELLEELGVSLFVRENRLVTLHWPRVSEWLTRLHAEGKRPPERLAQHTKPDPTVTYVKRRKTKL